MQKSQTRYLNTNTSTPKIITLATGEKNCSKRHKHKCNKGKLARNRSSTEHLFAFHRWVQNKEFLITNQRNEINAQVTSQELTGEVNSLNVNTHRLARCKSQSVQELATATNMYSSSCCSFCTFILSGDPLPHLTKLPHVNNQLFKPSP